MIDSHFSLSSTAGYPHRPESSQWNVISGSPPQPDDYMSLGYNAMNVESYNSIPLISDGMDAAYDYSAADTLPRHMDQSQAMTQDFADYMTGMDFAACTTAMDTSSMLATDSWTGGFGPPSPPDELEIAHRLGSSRHAPYPEETMRCEPLSISKIQPCRLDTLRKETD